MLHWHQSCGVDIGSELCSIVAPDTPDAIKVPTMTVDDHVRDEIAGGIVHVLKVDAEGCDTPSHMTSLAEPRFGTRITNNHDLTSGTHTEPLAHESPHRTLTNSHNFAAIQTG